MKIMHVVGLLCGISGFLTAYDPEQGSVKQIQEQRYQDLYYVLNAVLQLPQIRIFYEGLTDMEKVEFEEACRDISIKFRDMLAETNELIDETPVIQKLREECAGQELFFNFGWRT